jgi:hypothetical protein
MDMDNIIETTTDLPYKSLTQDEFDNLVKDNDFTLNDSHIYICGYFIPADIVFPEELKYISFKGCKFESREFEDINFNTCEFIMCDMSYMMFTNCKFISSAFCYTTLSNSTFVGCQFDCGWFDFANLNCVKFAYTNFAYFRLYNSTFKSCVFSDCEFDIDRQENCDFSKAVFVETNLPVSSHVPDTGSFIGWKKAKISHDKCDDDEYYIVKLRIPEDARRSNAGRSKCRADKAYVEDIQDLDGNSVDKVVESMWDSKFKYQRWQIVTEPNFCENRFEECARGIHFFLNRDDAVNFTF